MPTQALFRQRAMLLPGKKKPLQPNGYKGFYKSGRRDSNSRHFAWEANALPLNYSRRPNTTPYTIASFTPVQVGLCGVNNGGGLRSALISLSAALAFAFVAVHIAIGRPD